jgi:putative nucleotidyltransferase with HDIG domain
MILMCGLTLPSAYEFVLIQICAGFTAVITMSRIRYLSQFFLSGFWILLTYLVVYFALRIIQYKDFTSIHYTDFLWFGGNFILLLITYPIIFANEKLFGLISDISLLEYSDINNKLLKELSTKAPGTFQHSLQVANLAEAVINEIGGNALLARVGALYHDIGKMDNPQYFIENQNRFGNPHSLITEEQSAEIIIKHVANGVKIAEENNLPIRLIDFIKMHHGTTRVEYFYHNFIKKHPNEYVDEGSFRYPGPKPNSKETAVVMLCDSIEAASHALKNPDEDQLDKLID